MSSATTASVKGPPQEPANLAAFLSYLVPGLGQIYQGRYAKGVLFMVSLLGMFMLGQAMGEWQNVYVPREKGNLASSLVMRWHYVGQFWIGAAAWPALWQYFGGPLPSEESNPFVHNLQRMPDETKLNRFLVNSDKTPDLGWVYTVVAGMLNILVIYDAYAGPMFLGSRPTSKGQAGIAEAKKEGAA
jgi:hypothetical protein